MQWLVADGNFLEISWLRTCDSIDIPRFVTVAAIIFALRSASCNHNLYSLARPPPNLISNLVLERITHALHTGASRQRALVLVLLLVLPHLGNGVDDTGNEANEDGAAAAKSGRRIEEDETREGNGELVEGADHGVGGGGGDANAPGGAVGDEDGADAGKDHDEEDFALLAWREVDGDVGGGPVLEEEGADEEDGDGKEVVVEHG